MLEELKVASKEQREALEKEKLTLIKEKELFES